MSECGYTKWAWKMANRHNPVRDRSQEEESKGLVVLPYVHGVSEPLKRIFSKHNMKVVFKPVSTLRQQLGSAKYPTPTLDKCGTIYHIPCQGCTQVYVGETGRPLRKRLNEHQKLDGPNITAVGYHTLNTGHTMRWDDVTILNSDSRVYPRKIKESIEIKLRKPELNDNQGYQLSPLYTPLIMELPKPTSRSTAGPHNSHSQPLTEERHGSSMAAVVAEI